MYLILAASAAIGAFIGYTTNFIAIKSLFRPLEPRWYTLGWQGVIPRNRHRLAENIARVVGEDLLGRDYLAEQVKQPGLQKKLHDFVALKIRDILDTTLATAFGRLPSSWQHGGFDAVTQRMLAFLADWCEEERGRELRRQTARHAVERLRLLDLGEALPPEQAHELTEAVAAAFGLPDTREQITALLQRQLEGLLDGDRAVEDLLPEELRQLLHQRLQEQVPAIIARVAQWLEKPENLDQMTDRILMALESYGESSSLLGNLIAQLGLGLFGDQIRNAIREKLPRIAGDYLHSPGTRERIEAQLVEVVDRFLKKSMRDLTGGHHVAIAEKVGFVAGTWVTSPEVRDQVSRLLQRKYAENASKELGDVLPQGVWAQLEKRLFSMLRIPSERTAEWGQALAAWIRPELQSSNLRLRDWSGMSSENEENLVQELTQRGSELLQTEVPLLMDQLDFRRLVKEKIMGFDLLRVERMIKEIIDDQLRFINLLGAVLGAIVGLLLPFINARLAAAGL